MSFHITQPKTFCVVQKYYPGTKNIVGQIRLDEKTAGEIKLLFGQWSICNRRKSMIVSDNSIQAEGLGDFF